MLIVCYKLLSMLFGVVIIKGFFRVLLVKGFFLLNVFCDVNLYNMYVLELNYKNKCKIVFIKFEFCILIN